MLQTDCSFTVTATFCREHESMGSVFREPGTIEREQLCAGGQEPGVVRTLNNEAIDDEQVGR